MNVSTSARPSSGRASTDDDVFFVVDGTYDVLISHFGLEPDYIRTLHAGDSFGELGVLYDVPRTATVRCTVGRRTFCGFPARHFSTRSKPGPDRRHNGRVDEAALRQLIDDVRAGTRRRPTPRSNDFAGCRSSRSATRWSTTTASLRQGMPEAVYGRGKSAEQCVAIVGELLANGSGPVLLTRADDAQTQGRHRGARPRRASDRRDRCGVDRMPHRAARVLVASAGTSDGPIVDECVLTLRAYGFEPDRLADVGVAGLHRLLAHVDRITSRRCGGRGRRDGGGAGQRDRWVDQRAGRRRADQRRLRGEPRRRHRAAGDARLVRQWSHGGRNRQRVWSSVRDRQNDAVTRTAWFHCFAGTAGDMTMAALVDAGADPLMIADDRRPPRPRRLRVDVRAVMRCGIAATQATSSSRPHGHDHDDHDHTNITTAATGRSAS